MKPSQRVGCSAGAAHSGATVRVSQCLAVVPGGSEAFVRGSVLSAGYSFIWLPGCWAFCITPSCFLLPRLMVSP